MIHKLEGEKQNMTIRVHVYVKQIKKIKNVAIGVCIKQRKITKNDKKSMCKIGNNKKNMAIILCINRQK